MKRLSHMVVAAFCAGVILSACSDSDSDGGDGQAGTSGVTAEDIATGVSYIGGKAGKADSSLDPVTIGFVNAQGAVPAFPEHEKAADAAVDFINNELGGIDGHPLKLEKCFIQAEEDGQKCASQLLQARVPIGNLAVSVYGNATLFKLIGDAFPTIVSVGVTAADTNSENVYGIDGGALNNLKGMMMNAKPFGSKMSVISSNNPAAKFLMTDIILPFAKEQGFDTTAVYVSDTATTPDYVSALQTSGAADSDVIFALPATVAGCVSLYDSMKQVSLVKPVTAPSPCASDPMPEKTGGGPEGWIINGLSEPVFLDSPQANAVSHVMDAAGFGSVKNAGFAAKSFSDIMTIAKFANAIGFDDLSPARFTEQILSFEGPAWMIPGAIKCGVNTEQISLCGDSSANYEFRDGAWRSLPPYTAAS